MNGAQRLLRLARVNSSQSALRAINWAAVLEVHKDVNGAAAR